MKPAQNTNSIHRRLKLLALTSLMIGSAAMAQRFGRGDSVEINYWGLEVQGSQTLFLKQELNRQNPRFDDRNFEIERIILVAKSEHGRGEAQADIGGVLSERRMVDGRPRDFYTRDPRTFYSIEFYNPNRMSQGHWQIHLNGHIMVDRVILVGNRDFRPGPGYPGRPDPRPHIEYYSAGDERTQKLVETSKEFRTRHFDEAVFSVRITGTKERVRILRAVAEMNDGRTFELPELRTTVREGQEVGAMLRGEYIRKVVITAMTDNLTGSRGEYRLDFGVRRR